MSKDHKTILIVEDEQAFRGILEAELGKEGFSVQSAADGVEGLEVMRKERPDLVLLDIVMPKKDGFSVLEEMKSDAGLQDVPVFVLSNSGDVVELSWARKLGAEEVLVKAAFGPKELVRKIRDFFNGRGKNGRARALEKAQAKQKKNRACVLLVEDEPDLRELLGIKLESEGYTVMNAGTGGEALSKAKDSAPDIVLLDLILPDMSGFQVLAQLREAESTRNVPVIVLSNLGQQGDVSKALDAGAQDYLIKAHNTPSEIAEKIKKAVTRDRSS